MKTCSKCGATKSLSEFSKRNGVADGVQAWCRECAKRYRNDPVNKPRLDNIIRLWAVNNNGRVRASGRRNDAKRIFGRDLQKYGMTEADYRSLLLDQGMGCAICGTMDPGEKRKRFTVDHDHDTKEVRGLLCHKCNAAIGMLNDDAFTVGRAFKYLEDSGKRRLGYKAR